MPPLEVLLIDESDGDGRQLAADLTRAGYQPRVSRVTTPEALIDALERQHWDLAVSDYALPLLSGTRAIALVREHGGDVPFIFVSSQPGEAVAVEAMRLGAQDFLSKQNRSRLGSAVDEVLRASAERQLCSLATERLSHLAFHDELTNLPNRSLLRDRLAQALLEARREKRHLCVLVVDLDGFKLVNDSLGHAAGDRVLEVVADRLRSTVRQADTVARLGGDEFAVLLPSTELAGAELTARKLLEELEVPMSLETGPVFIRASVGIAGFPDHAVEPSELLEKADQAMYVAKQQRSGHAVYSATRDNHVGRRVALVAALWQAVDNDQFTLDYQPIVNLRSNLTVGVEALLRWNHPQYGRLVPGQFIALAEQAGLITRLTLWAIRRTLAEWATLAHQLILSVNVSPQCLNDPTFATAVAAALDEFGVAPASLALEITENVVLDDRGRAVECLDSLHHMGVRIVIDDFGTGYSSLRHLRRLPVSQLKIDRSFVSGLASGEDDALVRSIVDLAHNLGLEVIAEGVDSSALRDHLRALGCDGAQGHFISEPAAAAVIRSRLEPRRRARRAG